MISYISADLFKSEDVALSTEQQILSTNLKNHIWKLAGDIGADTPEKICFDKLAVVTDGLSVVIHRLLSDIKE